VLRTRNSWLLRPPAQIVIWVLLLVVMFGPRRPMTVCTGESCCAVDHQTKSVEVGEPECASCGCCAPADAGPADADAALEAAPGSRPTRHRGRTCVDCCIDVSLPIELTLVPRTVEVPEAGSATIGAVSVAFLPVIVPTGNLRSPFDTGPPRPDPRTNLLATTILRQ